MSVYIAVYIVDTVLLYGYSAFGMPVSTTACLVFELLGASYALGGPGVVHWDKAGTVHLRHCGVDLRKRDFRVSSSSAPSVGQSAIGTTHLATLLAHGGWTGGGMLAGLTYFMLVKGMSHVSTSSKC